MSFLRHLGFVILFFSVLLGGGVSLGVFSARSIMAMAEDRYTELQNFTKVLNLVQQYYVEEVDIKKLVYGGIKGMLRELDPHTNFLPPDIYKEFENETSGEFGGLGIEISLEDGVISVISPIEDTPAWKAGILPGDKIIAIDGKATKGLSIVEAAKDMRGKEGTSVKLLIVREGLEKPQEFVIKRGKVRVKSAKYIDLDEGFAYVRITSFIENTEENLLDAIKKHKDKHGDLKGLILDLRRNPGGLLDQAVKVSDMFLNGGVIVSTMGRNKKEKEVIYAKQEGTMAQFPLIVLINGSSASASEIVAGALQDNKRAVIMGERSFGKGSVQSVVKLGDGSGLKLTVAKYYTPSGISIQAEGIKPDVVLENVDTEAYKKSIINTRTIREKDIQGHLRGDHEDDQKVEAKKKLTPKEELLTEDFQVMQAFNHLKAWNVLQKLEN